MDTAETVYISSLALLKVQSDFVIHMIVLLLQAREQKCVWNDHLTWSSVAHRVSGPGPSLWSTDHFLTYAHRMEKTLCHPINGGGGKGLRTCSALPSSSSTSDYQCVQLSRRSLSLQMLKHGRAGVPMEVMGLMLGEFVDDYTVTVIDVFAMPQSGTVSV